jgi:hypothetical protein
MQIANPIYDVVFKYLLDDNKVAKKLLGLIIEKEIKTLSLRPTEMRVNLEGRSSAERPPLAVFHLDFTADILEADGQKKRVIIELQKAKLSSEIMRFRRYLASQYASKDDQDGEPLPIFSIYILGHQLKGVPCPVVDIKRQYIDRANHKVLAHRDDFVESLTHDSVMIQVGRLKDKRRNTLEKVLAIFEGGKLKKHLLEFNESDYPADYAEVIRRLQKAIAEPKVLEMMNIEDELLADLLDLEAKAAKAQERAEKAERQAEEADRKAEDSDRRAKEEESKNKKLLDLLRQHGIEPEQN